MTNTVTVQEPDTSNSLNEERQQLHISGLIELYEVDLTRILQQLNLTLSSNILRFVSNQTSRFPIYFKNEAYIPINIDIDGFELKSQQKPKRPTVKISNLYNDNNQSFDSTLGITITSLENLIGASFKRIITYASHCYIIDHESMTRNLANNEVLTAEDLKTDKYTKPGMLPPNEYFVSRKSAHNNKIIEFELTTELDLHGQKFPNRRMFRNFCSYTYRFWNQSLNDGEGGFIDVSSDINNNPVTCPYRGSGTWDYFNNPSEAHRDECNRSFDACKLRFPNGPLPLRAYPGIAGYRRQGNN